MTKQPSRKEILQKYSKNLCVPLTASISYLWDGEFESIIIAGNLNTMTIDKIRAKDSEYVRNMLRRRFSELNEQLKNEPISFEDMQDWNERA